MDDAGDRIDDLRTEPERALHIRRLLIVFEVLWTKLVQYRRGERPELLAKLHPTIDLILDHGRPRVCENRAVPERARTEFRAALYPSHDVSCGDHLRRPLRSSAATLLYAAIAAEATNVPQRLWRHGRSEIRRLKSRRPTRMRVI